MMFLCSLLLGCFWANTGPLSWGTPRQTDVKHFVRKIFLSEVHRESGNKTGSLSQLFVLLIFGDLLTRSQNGHLKKVITASVGFCTLTTSVIVKVMFRLLQQVVLKEYAKSFNLSFFVFKTKMQQQGFGLFFIRSGVDPRFHFLGERVDLKKGGLTKIGCFLSGEVQKPVFTMIC